MALKFKFNCKVCHAIQERPKLARRIQESVAYVHGGESLLHISQTEELPYRSLVNHCRKHQGLSDKELKQQAAQDALKKTQIEQLKRVVRHSDVRQTILDKGIEQIESGKVRLTASAIVAASKHASDIEEKHLDRQLEIIKMVNAFASGEEDGTVLELDDSPEAAANRYIEG